MLTSVAKRYEPLSRKAVLEAGAGMVLGLFSWIGYRELSVVDPFQSRGTSGVLVCALIGAVIYRTRLRPIMWAIAGSLAFMIVLVAYTPIIRRPAQSFIRIDPIRNVDAVVVLSSSVSDDQVLDQQGMDRLLTGLQLVRQGVAKNLVVTRIRLVGSEAPLFSVYDQIRLYKLAGSPGQLMTTQFTANTHEEAVETRKIADRKGWKRVAVVTSPTHTRRACAAFEKVGLSVVCVPALSRDVAIGTLVQPGDRLRAFQLWLYESMAVSEYKRRGWI